MRSILTNQGYTLIESLVQLLVLILFSQLLFFYSAWMKDLDELYLTREHEEWELFSLDIENYFHEIQTIEELPNYNGIRLTKDGVEYDIEISGDLIRKQKNRLGHEPMLLHIQRGRFEIKDSKIIVWVQFKNGVIKERLYEVLLLPK